MTSLMIRKTETVWLIDETSPRSIWTNSIHMIIVEGIAASGISK